MTLDPSWTRSACGLLGSGCSEVSSELGDAKAKAALRGDLSH